MTLILNFKQNTQYIKISSWKCIQQAISSEFVSASPTNGRIHLHAHEGLEAGHKAKTKGLKLVSHLKSDPLRNQIREFPLGTGKQTNKFDLRTNRFSHAYPMVCLPEDGLSSSEKGSAVASLSKGPVPRLVWPDFPSWLLAPGKGWKKLNANEFEDH